MKPIPKIATISDAFNYFFSLSPKFGTWTMSQHERRQRLPRMRLFLEELGNPHQAYKSFHVAGTKGKGSTAAFLASILKAAGYRTGRYSSPHVSDPAERIAVFDAKSFELPPPELLTALTARIAQLHDSVPQRPRAWAFPVCMFELLTLFALLYFREVGCQYVVVETGIGGRYDATNIIEPLASVLTPVDYDHTEILGTTLEEIASQKSGIIKPGIPVFCSKQAHEVKTVFREAASSQNAPAYFLDEEAEELSSCLSADGTTLTLKFRHTASRHCRLALLGDFQADNAALAYVTISKTLPQLHEKTIERGLQETFLPGRMELILTRPPIVLDGAHTPLSVYRLLDSFKKIFPQKGILIFGSVAGKKPAHMARILAPAFQKILISTPGNFKQSHPDALCKIFQQHHAAVYLEKNPSAALQQALLFAENTLPVLVTGSFFLVADIRQYLRSLS